MAKRPDQARTNDERRTPRKPRDGVTQRRGTEAPPRGRRSTREQRPPRPDHPRPHNSPTPRPVDGPVRPKNAAQAKARAKARKAKAPKVVRAPLRERLLVRLAAVDFDPRRFVTRVPFVVLVIGALGVGLGVTLWLSTDAAERSYELGRARQVNQALLQQKEGLERDVLEAQAAPALAEAARNLGMIPSRDTAHLVQDPTGNWLVVGTPKPAQGVQPPPLNSPLPEPGPPAPPAPPAPRVVEPREVAVHLPPRPATLPNPAAALPNPAVLPNPAAVPNPEILPNPEVAVPAPAGVPVPAPAAPLDAAGPHLESPQTPPLPGPPPGAEPVLEPVPAPVPGAPA
ncbi:hypothetical protein TUM20985_22390 [Mycobacterium antarcticum]|uniref:hypothetical protein n=1 Tax=unclassified Mycolicibacterium TaxID=2636767 RepID=UPI00239CB52D|nr:MULTISPECIES: hypothetical protein [unclassified Mycolicibacterium]BDX31692.1 hypothetical protein TUM20985_22390 [Mycolicibacterium sp. TUM20985]GLP74989.1 hypothetical protein TUM20983_20990 [Mycolicibacterium sp. TUM20983]GLP80778.1 hypothetical protein TUM20984_21980 [Mycolicibacterium sp. TUM20984]